MLCSQEEGAVRLLVTVFRLISIFALLAVLPDASLPISLFLCCCLPLGTQLLLLSIPRALGGAGSNVALAALSRSPLGSLLLAVGLWDGTWEPWGCCWVTLSIPQRVLDPSCPASCGSLGDLQQMSVCSWLLATLAQD